jgi:hypothetical protein
VEECKVALPKFKKLRNRDFQFGYRLIADGEGIFIVGPGSAAAAVAVACEPVDAAAIVEDSLKYQQVICLKTLISSTSF